MTRVFSEGFEMRDIVGLTSTASINTTYKRSGSACLNVPHGSYYLTIPVSDLSEAYLRFGLYWNGTSSGTFKIHWRKGSTSLGYLSFGDATNGFFELYINSILVATGTNELIINTWYLVEVRIQIADAGVVQVKIEGLSTLDIDYSGDTKPGADADFDNIHFINNGLTTASLHVYLDDMAINDTAGGVDDSWCGDGHIIVIKPNGDTATLELTPSAAVGHYTLVDDIPADGDTTYVEGSVVDERDIYDLEACGLGDVIITRIWTEARAKDTATSGKTIALITKASGGAEVSGGDVGLAGGYTVKVLGAEELVNPVDSAAWEVADIDALQGGPKTRS